jgi:hypothetical protein
MFGNVRNGFLPGCQDTFAAPDYTKDMCISVFSDGIWQPPMTLTPGNNALFDISGAFKKLPEIAIFVPCDSQALSSKATFSISATASSGSSYFDFAIGVGVDLDVNKSL